MNKKILSLVIVAGLLAAFALIWQVGGNSATNSKSDTSMDKTMTSENPDSSQMMMDNSKILGVVLKDGKVMSVWPGNELMELESDLVLNNGTKISKTSGMIVSPSGSKIVLKEGQLLSQDGKLSSIDISKMKFMESHDTSMMKDDSSMNKPDSKMMMEHPGKYVDYSDTVVTNEHAAGNKVVLFFHAPWCPFCREADAAFKSNSSKIPSSVTVVKTDYDSSVELKRKYAVTTQHTFVQVDSSGNLITKWIGGDIANLQKYIK